MKEDYLNSAWNILSCLQIQMKPTSNVPRAPGSLAPIDGTQFDFDGKNKLRNRRKIDRESEGKNLTPIPFAMQLYHRFYSRPPTEV